jgi:hypothetical protein
MSYRVVVWGPGNVGRPAIHGVVRNPALELAGVIVHSPEKEGRDAGELAGIENVGVGATRDWQAALADRPDALVYAVNADFRPLEAIEECCHALAAGVNVVSAGMYGLLHPGSAEPGLRERFEAACKEGGSSFFTSGIDPGFAIDLLPLVLSGTCQEIRRIVVSENFNYEHYDQPDAVRSLVGMGMPMDATPPMLLPIALESVWGGIIRALGEALGVEVSEIRTETEKHALERTVTNAMGSFEAGSQGAFRFEVQGIVDGQPKIVVEHVTRICDDTAPQWPKPAKQGHHQIRIEGAPELVVTVECEDAAGNHAGGGNAAAAGRIVNAIPTICEAPPGVIAGASLPLITGRGLFA